jgi:opacity protein-like surface antigen
MRKYVLYCAAFLALSAAPAEAQKAWGGTFYGGIPVPVGTTADYVGPSFSWGGGVRFAKPDAPWALRFDIRNSRFNIHEDFFLGANPIFQVVDDGFARTWDFALSGEIGLPENRPFRIYGVAGVGYYNRYVALTDTQLASGCYWDPWWGYICGTGAVDAILVDKSDWNFGFNFGAGMSYKVQGGVTLFIEAIYNTVSFNSGDTNQGTNGVDKSNATTWMPIVFGIKF